MTKRYYITHVFPTQGGLQKRLRLIAEVMRDLGEVHYVSTFTGVLRLLLSTRLCRGDVVVIVSSLMALYVLGLKLLHREVTVYYLVRGDEITWALFHRRLLRAGVAWCLQWLLSRSSCEFLFVSEDLQEVFTSRYGSRFSRKLMPNTVGRSLPRARQFNGKVAIVGDFGSVKNVESILEQLTHGMFTVDLYGNTTLPSRWCRPWLRAHGHVDQLRSRLSASSVLVLGSVTEGFPNVLLDALEAGCAIVAHKGFPFRCLPIAEPWRFEYASDRQGSEGAMTSLEATLQYLLKTKRDFFAENQGLYRLVEQDWRQLVLHTFK